MERMNPRVHQVKCCSNATWTLLPLESTNSNVNRYVI